MKLNSNRNDREDDIDYELEALTADIQKITDEGMEFYEEVLHDDRHAPVDNESYDIDFFKDKTNIKQVIIPAKTLFEAEIARYFNKARVAPDIDPIHFLRDMDGEHVRIGNNDWLIKMGLNPDHIRRVKRSTTSGTYFREARITKKSFLNLFDTNKNIELMYILNGTKVYVFSKVEEKRDYFNVYNYISYGAFENNKYLNRAIAMIQDTLGVQNA